MTKESSFEISKEWCQSMAKKEEELEKIEEKLDNLIKEASENIKEYKRHLSRLRKDTEINE